MPAWFSATTAADWRCDRMRLSRFIKCVVGAIPGSASSSACTALSRVSGVLPPRDSTLRSWCRCSSAAAASSRTAAAAAPTSRCKSSTAVATAAAATLDEARAASSARLVSAGCVPLALVPLLTGATSPVRAKLRHRSSLSRSSSRKRFASARACCASLEDATSSRASCSASSRASAAACRSRERSMALSSTADDIVATPRAHKSASA
mmetsp:Transcript_9943/g.32595  ORF Transcript_9943/g.32595 Transcript_9943/m.32595 type:complete len:208 (-) Transcript_9943:235-858(-)